ncbi:hypothetical protein [Neobacillus bataviensis]|uniref:hypothetical protein n=1 Tax=Neobacillus bataviensis TaxID=220685 RepID=UPI001CBF01E2|nr:hypothetical protein [Neobacillus bataviensis]
MKIEALQSARVKDFVEYCKRHRKEVDDSFLYDEHLKKFEPDSESPTYIATNQQGEIRAAASLIMDEYNRRGKRARFRIFHSEIDDRKLYDQLLESLIKHTSGLNKVFIFIPLANKPLHRPYTFRKGLNRLRV